jgi:hypothetical protein
VKIHWNFLKIFFRTSRPNSIKLSTNYPWVKGIQVCSNKGPGPLQRGDNHKNVKMGWDHWKIFFSRTIGPILTRLCTNHLLQNQPAKINQTWYKLSFGEENSSLFKSWLN